ncbi:unnamed protein product, partial [Adineta steineri]
NETEDVEIVWDHNATTDAVIICINNETEDDETAWDHNATRDGVVSCMNNETEDNETAWNYNATRDDVKLSDNENDLCGLCIGANRYGTELQNLIVVGHTHYPVQQLLQDLDYKHSPAAFLNILFDLITYSSDSDLLCVNQTEFQPVPLKQTQNVVKFDMKLLFFHDPTGQNQTISFSLICSQDVFDIETVEELSKQFQHLLSQLFVKHPSSFDLVN